MRFVVSVPSALAFALASGICLTAHAGGTAKASLAGLHFSTIDLNLADGVAASLTLVSNPDQAAVGTAVATDFAYETLHDPFQSLSTFKDTPLRFASAQIDSDSALAEVHTPYAIGWLNAESFSVVDSNSAGDSRYGLLLTPYTELRIEAQLHSFASVANPGWRGDTASAVAEMTLTLASSPGSTTLIGQSRVYSSAGFDPSLPVAEVYESEASLSASLLFVNDTAQPMWLGFRYDVRAGTTSVTGEIPSIPEPSTAWMLAVGLLSMGLARRAVAKRGTSL